MSLNRKMLLMIVTPLLFIALLVSVGWWALGKSSDTLDSMVNEQFLVLINNDITPLISDSMLPLINHDLPQIQELQGSVRLLLEADRDVHQAVIAEKQALVATTAEESAAADKANAENIGQAQERMARAAQSIDAEEGKQLYAQYLEAAKDWEAKSRKVMELAATPGKLQFARKASDQGSAFKAFGAMRDIIDKIQAVQEKEIETLMAQVGEKKKLINQNEQSLSTKKTAVVGEAAAAQSLARKMSLVFIVIGALAAVAVCLIGYGVARSISRPLAEAVNLLTEAVAQVTAASHQFAEAGHQLTEGATEQAASLEESSSALEELAGQSRGNSENAHKADTLMGETRKLVVETHTAMGQMVETMSGIKTSSSKVSGIIKTIEEIAFQTNLLALNAAVEAARAGEHGKGFAVVAEEVRNLAQRSAVAARDTAGLIEESVNQANRGATVVERAAQGVEKITESANVVGDTVGAIATASAEQADGVNQINTAIAQMDQATQHVAAIAEETASSASEMADQARKVDEVAGRLAALVSGRERATSETGPEMPPRIGAALPTMAGAHVQQHGRAKAIPKAIGLHKKG